MLLGLGIGACAVTFVATAYADAGPLGGIEDNLSTGIGYLEQAKGNYASIPPGGPLDVRDGVTPDVINQIDTQKEILNNVQNMPQDAAYPGGVVNFMTAESSYAESLDSDILNDSENPNSPFTSDAGFLLQETGLNVDDPLMQGTQLLLQ